MSELTVKCDLCGEVIAKTTEEAVSFPMTGAMFGSPDINHGIPDPFDKSLSWEEFRCPYGKTHRPFISQEALTTTTGQYRVAKDGINGEFVDNRMEIGRESVIDRPFAPTDEQAAAIVRAEIGAKPTGNNNEKATDDIPPKTEKAPYETVKIECDVCGRSFQQRGYLSHRKSHKEIKGTI